jgi:hypothetical protein
MRPPARLAGPLVVALASLAVFPIAACSRKLTQEDCNGLLGRGVGLAAYSGSAEVPVDIELLKKRARREAKAASEAFDKACVGAPDNGEVTCSRRANDSAQFVACGELVKKAREAGEIVQNVIAKQHSADECSKYAEHGVKIGVGSVDDAGRLMRDCDQIMEIGVYKCRMAAQTVDAWNACDAP